MKQYRYVLLDADQTLFDFERSEAAALSELLLQRGIAPKQRLLRLYHEINDAMWKAYERGEVSQEALKVRRFELFSAQTGIRESAELLAKEYMNRLSQQAFLFDGARELLCRLAERYSLALVTNGVGFIQRSRIEKSGIAQYFRAIVISGEVGLAKPDAAFVRYALDALACADPQQAVLVGDSLTADVQAGCNAGIDTVWFCPSGKISELPTYTVRSYEELTQIL